MYCCIKVITCVLVDCAKIRVIQNDWQAKKVCRLRQQHLQTSFTSLAGSIPSGFLSIDHLDPFSLTTLQAEVGRSNVGKDFGVEEVVRIRCSVIHLDGNERSAWFVGSKGRLMH